MVGGDFTMVWLCSKLLTRLNADGLKDTTLNPGGFGSSGIATGLKVLADDKILAGGSISSYNYQSGRNSFVRLNANGTLDQNFAVDYDGYVAGATEIVLQPDNKILVVGTLTYFNNQPPRSLISLNYNGSNDSTFKIQGGSNTNLITCALQDDSKVVIAGNFTNYNGVNINRIARINGGSLLSVSEQTKEEVKIYPNPVFLIEKFTVTLAVR
ncbi:delta-60 repeat domain-containing protein [Chryseobacterium mucoviscidosis]|uniref:delta-60 repeat domain-containing protein n=1 Tax=Chryseobacterium mucoviscidosis TaxID=1945581 RepID=UPI0021CEA086|nr:delta-60 repeat domain-containing protein [Chryseobacterium mucoviscidosis]